MLESKRISRFNKIFYPREKIDRSQFNCLIWILILILFDLWSKPFVKKKHWEKVIASMLRFVGIDALNCPRCGVFVAIKDAICLYKFDNQHLNIIFIENFMICSIPI